MAVTIEEVTAEVEPPERRERGSETRTEQQASKPSDMRKQREYFDRLRHRASRVCAD